MFEVTEGVARHALTRLRLEGLAYPRQGKGWYVENPLPEEGQSLTQLVGKLQDRVDQLAMRVEQLESAQEPQPERPIRRGARPKS
jgi:DNA-binding GntR family transcriptional regulator